jgi:hypothetical protein
MKLTALLLVIGVMAISSPAWAPCYFTSFTADVDCEGWTASGAVNICGDYDTLGYVVELREGDLLRKSFSGHFLVTDAVPTFSFNFPWGEELCGDFVATMHFYYVDPAEITDVRDYREAFTCDCDEPDGECHYTPGYWKNHPEAWPVMTLTVGGIMYNQAQLIEILSRPVVKDPTVILAHHLIAAKLNVANGADDSINDEIAAADALLRTYPLGSNPGQPAKTMIICAKNDLAAYNQMILPGCEGYIAPTILLNREGGPSAAPGTESATWGKIKNIYR